MMARTRFFETLSSCSRLRVGATPSTIYQKVLDICANSVEYKLDAEFVEAVKQLKKPAQARGKKGKQA
jgi:hypothetical protein